MARQSFTQKTSDSVAKGAMAGVLDDLFQDMYSRRWQVYKMNFIRGISFGLGGVLGGTILVILLVWALSFFDHLPIIGHFVETVRHSLETTQKK